MRQPRSAEAALIEREHLTRILLEQMERTFSTEGARSAVQVMERLLLHLDENALREFAYQSGITAEDELEPDVEERGAPPEQ
ncbi:MAG TPA: hypothetical protein VFU00_00740 [Gemmatimonadales bacterium]|nr:hypothetical protein [Gemmatimonadales bacterium]